jgi:hypothetical protein
MRIRVPRLAAVGLPGGLLKFFGLLVRCLALRLRFTQ